MPEGRATCGGQADGLLGWRGELASSPNPATGLPNCSAGKQNLTHLFVNNHRGPLMPATPRLKENCGKHGGYSAATLQQLLQAYPLPLLDV